MPTPVFDTYGDGTTNPSLRLVGALDAVTVHDIEPSIQQVLATHPSHVIVDFNDLWLLDSSGVGALVSLLRRVKAEGGDVVVIGAHDQPLALMKLLKLDRVFGL